MYRIRSLVIMIVSMALAACSSLSHKVQPESPLNEGSGVVESVPAEPNFPEIELSQEILFQYLKAEIALKRGHYDVAVDEYLSLAHSTQDPRFAERAVQVALFTGDNANALEGAELWVKIDPENGRAQQAITSAYLRNGNPDAAIIHLQRLLSLEENPDKGYMLIVSLLTRENDRHAALGLMERFIAQSKPNPSAYYAYSRLAFSAGQLETALIAVDQALALRSGWVEAIALKSRVLQLQDKPQKAMGYMAQQVKKHSDDLELRLVYTRLLVDTQQYEEAISQYKIALKQSPDNEVVLYAMGLLSLQLNRLDDAERYLKSIDRQSQRANEVQFSLGRLEEIRENYSAAIEHYSAVGRSERYLDAGMRVAILVAQNGELEEARDRLHKLHMSAHLPTDRQRLYLLEGQLLLNAEQYEEGMEVYNLALDELPENTNLLYSRAILAEKMDRLDIMEQDLRLIIEHDPDNVTALNALGYTLADRTDRYEEALGYIERALELSPDDNAIIDSMGWVLYRLGRYEEALKYLRQSFEAIADPEVAAHLGEVLWFTGAHDEARGVFEKALSSSPGDKLILDVMKRLEQ